MEAAKERVNESEHSSFYEQLVEHTFVSEILQEACFRYNSTIEVLHSEVDAYGYDLVLEFRGIVRHVQLKTSKHDGATSRQKVSVNLAKKINGCVVWVERSAESQYRTQLKYRFFGKKPGESLLTELEKAGSHNGYFYKTATHTKANTEGEKGKRINHRVVPKNAFYPKGDAVDMRELFIMLFEKRMTFDETLLFVKAQAVKFKAAEEGWDYDIIGLNTFREILRFAISEGFQADTKAVDRVLNGEDESSEDEDDENTDWHFMGIVTEAMEEQVRKQVLPEKTTAIYKMWLAESRDIDEGYWD